MPHPCPIVRGTPGMKLPLIADTWRLGREVPEAVVPGGKQEQPQEEFKRDAVALVHSSGKTVNEVARQLGVSAEGVSLENTIRCCELWRGRSVRRSSGRG